MKPWTFVSRDPDETFAAGRELGRAIGQDGVVIALVGPLGAGKTLFVKGLAAGLGLDPRRVSSPTFVIAQQYPVPAGPEILHHVDLYRLESESELDALGFDDLLAPGSVLAVEWADRFPASLGRDCLRIEFDGPSVSEADGVEVAPDRPAGPGRRARVSASGQVASVVAEGWFEGLERAHAAQEGTGDDGGRLPALVLLCMASLVLLAGGLDHWRLGEHDRGEEDCRVLVERAADEWGTWLAGCAAGAAGELPLRGVARLLDGETLDLARAPALWLEALPGIGPARASAIVQARATRPFERIEDLERVPGIGPVTRARIAGFVHLGEDERSGDGAG